MNFVLHHHLAHRDLGTPGAAIGSMLPDFWRMVDRRMRPSKSVDNASNEDVRQLLRGIDHHLWCDGWFHKHEAFLDGERRTAQALRAASFEAPKMVLMAHVCWELCLDGALLRRCGVESEVHQLQQNLEILGSQPLTLAASLHSGGRQLEDAFDDRLSRILEQAAYGSWVPGYAHGRGIADRLAGVRRRVRLPEMAAHDVERLAVVCDELLDLAERPIEELLRVRPRIAI